MFKHIYIKIFYSLLIFLYRKNEIKYFKFIMAKMVKGLLNSGTVIGRQIYCQPNTAPYLPDNLLHYFDFRLRNELAKNR